MELATSTEVGVSVVTPPEYTTTVTASAGACSRPTVLRGMLVWATYGGCVGLTHGDVLIGHCGPPEHDTSNVGTM